MRRIILNNGEFAISASGNDVITATDIRQFIFDSRRASIFGIFLSGTVGIGSFSLLSSTASGGQTMNTYCYDVWFGTWFANPPVAFVMIQNGNYGGACPYYGYNNTTLVVQNGNYSSTGGTTVAWYAAYNDHLRLFVENFISTTTAPNPVAFSFAIGHS